VKKPSAKNAKTTSSSTTAILARKLADRCQVPTQMTGSKAGRMLVVSSIFRLFCF
jgi:hypothetical protein